MRIVAGILVVLLLVSGGTFSAWAQSDSDGAARCMEDFDMLRIVAEQRFIDRVKSRDKDLFEYIWCRSIVDPAFAIQHDVFDWLRRGPYHNKVYGFWTQFSYEVKITPKFVMRSADVNDLSAEDSRVFLKGFLKRDPSACDRMSEQKIPTLCRAMLSLNALQAPDRKDRDFIYYLRALANYDAKECSKISSGYVRMTCRAVLASDPSLCEQCPSFERFKRTYCGS